MLNPTASGGLCPPWAPYQGFAMDPMGPFSGPQTPRPIILHPPFVIPGYGPGPLVYICFYYNTYRMFPGFDDSVSCPQSPISSTKFYNLQVSSGSNYNIQYNSF